MKPTVKRVSASGIEYEVGSIIACARERFYQNNREPSERELVIEALEMLNKRIEALEGKA